MPAPRDAGPPRVLILSASMGDGHLQVSRELARRLTARGHVVRIADLLTLMPRPAGEALRELYPWLVNRAPYLYEAIYKRIFLADRGRAQRREIARNPCAVALGWVEDMAPLMAAADVVLDNAAGSIAKEAMVIGRPVVTFAPLPGHGRHDATMMAQAGLTDVADDPGELARLLGELRCAERCAARVARARSLFGTDPARLIEAFARPGDRRACA